MKIKEQELNNYLYYFKNKDCKFEVTGDYKAKFELYRLQIWFDNNLGILHIKDYTNKDTITLNITEICNLTIEDNILYIQLDETRIAIKTINRRTKWKI